jgi:uncharacterized protein (UPF0303 family)
MVETTGGFSSLGLERESAALELTSLAVTEALQIGTIALDLAMERSLPIAIEVHLGNWVVFHASLPGSTPDKDEWLARKARVVLATGNSTMLERVWAQEAELDWYEFKGLPESTHAIHGGGVPLNVKGLGHVGTLVISGLPQVEDHLLCVEVISEFLARQGELQ